MKGMPKPGRSLYAQTDGGKDRDRWTKSNTREADWHFRLFTMISTSCREERKSYFLVVRDVEHRD